MNKELKEIVKQIEAKGYTVEKSKGGHLIVRNTEGKRVYALPSTPGQGRWRQNLLAELRRREIL